MQIVYQDRLGRHPGAPRVGQASGNHLILANDTPKRTYSLLSHEVWHVYMDGVIYVPTRK